MTAGCFRARLAGSRIRRGTDGSGCSPEVRARWTWRPFRICPSGRRRTAAAMSSPTLFAFECGCLDIVIAGSSSSWRVMRRREVSALRWPMSTSRARVPPCPRPFQHRPTRSAGLPWVRFGSLDAPARNRPRRCGDQRERRRHEGQPIVGGDAVDEAVQNAARRRRGGKTDDGAGGREGGALPDDQREHVDAAGAQGHPDGALSPPLGDAVAEQAVDAEGRQQERERRGALHACRHVRARGREAGCRGSAAGGVACRRGSGDPRHLSGSPLWRYGSAGRTSPDSPRTGGRTSPRWRAVAQPWRGRRWPPWRRTCGPATCGSYRTCSLTSPPRDPASVRSSQASAGGVP